MKTRLLHIAGLLLITCVAWSQPSITSFTPSSGPVGTTVTIAGTNFSATAANNLVYFGAVRASVTAATTTQLTVTVPAGAMYQLISVTVSGLKDYSASPFVVSFGGSGISASSFAARVNFVTGADPAYVALGDLDGDGKIDVATPNNASITNTSIFRNLSTGPGSLSFTTKTDITNGSNPIAAFIGDIDGDGLPDLVVANTGSASYSIFRNTSTSGTISFAAKVDITGAGTNPYDVTIGDIDGDGKADLVVANYAANGISVYRNTGVVGTIAFAAKVDYSTVDSPTSVSLNDLDGDGKLDIAVAGFLNTNTASLFRNTSTPGTVSLASRIALTTGVEPRSVASGDLDGDGKPDLAVANGGSNTMSIFRNTSTVGALSFDAKVDVATGTAPFSVAIGDIDGDTKVDLAVANFSAGTVSVFKNNSAAGSISLAAKRDFTAGTQPRSVFIADQDGDGKNDLTTANLGSDNFSVFRNTIPSPQSITFGALPARTFGDASFTVSATASSGLSVSFSSDNTTVANVVGTTVQIVGAGTCNIVASQAGNSSFSPAPNLSQQLVVSMSNQTITFGALAARNVGDVPFSLTASSSSGLTTSYTSSNPSVATVSGNSVTIVGVGSTTITASQAGNTNYNPATNVQQTLTVNKGNQTITFGSVPAKAFGDAPFALSATASSALAVNYTSSNTAVATISGSTVTVVGEGTTTITASQAGDANYNPATNVQQTLTVNKANQTITFGALVTKTIGDAPFALTATASSGLTVTYASSNTSVATISGSTVTVVGVGTASITASQAGNANYNLAANVQQTLTVASASQVITFGALATKTFGDPSFALTATASSGLLVSYSSSNTTVATVSGSTVTVIGVGTTTITASQAGNTNFSPAAPVQQTLTVSKANQSITFGALTNKTFGDAAYAISATASSGLPVLFTSSNTAVATVSGNTITIVGGGTTNIMASQAGNANYNPATNVQQALTVDKTNQTISFNTLPVKTFGDVPFTISAPASSTLPVTFVSSNTAVATVSGNTVTIVGGGTVTITAIQAGNGNYNAATSVDQLLTINKANQTITFGSLTPRNSGDSFLLTGTASSGLSVSYTSSNTAVATVSGSTVTVIGVGTTTITASQSGNASYNAATNVQQTLTVNKGNQAITFNSLADKTFGEAAFDLLATASSSLAVSFSSSNASVATISGSTVTIIGAGSTTITASQAGDANYNAAASVAQTLTVNKANQIITFAPLPSKSVGDPSFTLGATTSSGLAVSYGSSNASVATVSGNTVTVIGAGTAVITASQSGNANYNSAGDVTQSFLVKDNQTITFGAITDKTVGDAVFALSATASSSLPISFTSTSKKITINGTQVTIVSAGRASITAAQAGNTNLNAAPTVDRSFCIKPAKPVVILSNSNTSSPTLTSSASTGNQWYLNGNAISGATNETLSITQAGIYKVKVQVDDCISTFSDDQVLIVTAIEPGIAQELKLFPNPASEELVVTLGGFENNKAVTISVVDLLGHQFHHTTGKGGKEVRIDIRNFKEGHYVLLLTQGHMRITKKFVKSF